MLGSLLTKGSGEFNWCLSRQGTYGLRCVESGQLHWLKQLSLKLVVKHKVHFRPQGRVQDPRPQESGTYIEPYG